MAATGALKSVLSRLSRPTAFCGLRASPRASPRTPCSNQARGASPGLFRLGQFLMDTVPQGLDAAFVPDTIVDVRAAFGIETKMKVQAFSKGNEYVPERDPAYV